MSDYVCELCKREGILKITEHHLVPKEKGGKNLDTVWLCEDCHKHLHAIYTNKELAIRFNTLEKLQQDERILKYLNYIKKKCPTKSISIKK